MTLNNKIERTFLPMVETRSSEPLAKIKICFVCLSCLSTNVQGFLPHTPACRGRPPRAGLCSQATWECALPVCPGWGASCRISRLRTGRKKSTGSRQPTLPAESPPATARSPGHSYLPGVLENTVFRLTGADGGVAAKNFTTPSEGRKLFDDN